MSETKMPPDIATQLADNEKRLREAWGNSIPALSPEVLEQASRAVEQLGGRMSGNGRGATTLPGWTQGIPAHWLPALASAYRHRREEQYAHAAKAYYEYFLELEPVEKGWRPPDNYDILIIPHRLGDTECVGWFGALPEFLGSKLFDESFILVEWGHVLTINK